MKMAVFDFALRKKGVYGVLHIIILLLSLFLVISISIDTFKNIPFYTQTSYKKIQLWICLFFLFDFVLELFLSKDKLRYLRTHFIFLLVRTSQKNTIMKAIMEGANPKAGAIVFSLPVTDTAGLRLMEEDEAQPEAAL